jgi:hypothetical protein
MASPHGTSALIVGAGPDQPDALPDPDARGGIRYHTDSLRQHWSVRCR